jgi:two-component system, sensor histidine kinase RegB
MAAAPVVPTEFGGPGSLRRLLALRWIAILAELVALLLTDHLLGVTVALVPALLVCAGQAALNVASIARLRGDRVTSGKELFGQMLIDVFALTVVTYFAGGSTNPVITLYLPLIAVGATILPARLAASLAVISVACYTLVSLVHRDIHVHDHEETFRIHLIGMWLIFVFSALIIAWFVVRMTAAIRARDAALAAAREAALRNERVVALGNLAAGAAHELGTPLATMAVLAGELGQHRELPEQVRADINLMRSQVQECKRIITQLAEQAGNPRSESAKAESLDHWMAQIIDRWQLQRPAITPSVALSGQQPGPRIAADATLEQALLNLFNNAADASPTEVSIEAHWSADEVRVQVLDRGPGIAPEIERHLGRDPVTTRGDGHGYGVLLALAAIERAGGAVSFAARAGGGTTVQVRLPLVAIGAG